MTDFGLCAKWDRDQSGCRQFMFMNSNVTRTIEQFFLSSITSLKRQLFGFRVLIKF
jgi:hypothetical protein